jgi:hypothetical protein
MRIIHLARKPLTGSVATNVLDHGAGALNINGTRISTGGEVVKAPQSDPRNRGGVFGVELFPTDLDVDTFRKAQRDSIERTNTLGRWPANLVLEHQPGCRLAGTTRIPSPTRKPTGKPVYPTDGPSMKWSPNSVADTTTRGHADADGKEAVAVWVCEPGCPVAALDEQSGLGVSPKAGRPKTTGTDFGMINDDGWEPKGSFIQGYADAGGASRFYKQVGGSE